MEQRKSSANLSLFNLSKSLRSPIADSTRILKSPTSSTGNSRTTQKRKPTSPLSSRNAMSRTSLGAICYNRTIDSQTYTDATSDGIASRLVKYGGLNEQLRTTSNSLRSSFIRTSPFPVIKLKKPSVKASPKRSISLSHVRIAPPERVIFQATSRSNILRSGSLSALNSVQRNDNEPLNPSSVSEVGISPARSSLDALKEISRKRINSEELDAERIKKQCKEVSEVDNPNNGMTTVTDIMYRNANVAKRPRESGTSPTNLQNGEIEKQKKRFCTKNNEVKSSYSSSISLTTPRRQLNELQIRKVLDLNREPPPETPANISQAQAARPTVLQQTNFVAIHKEVVQPPVSVQVSKAPSAPKITLFNKKYNQTPASKTELKNIDSDEEANKVHFVKPKQSNPLINNCSDSIRNAEKSKLALLLQCLAGDSDDDSQDMVDSKSKDNNIESSRKPIEIQLETKQSDTTSTIKPILNATISIDKPKSDEVKAPATAAEIIQPTPVKPAFSFGVTSTTSAPASTSNTTTTITSAAPSFTFGVAPTSSVSATSSISSPTTSTTSIIKTSETSAAIFNPSSTSASVLIPSVIVSTSSFSSNSSSAFAPTNAASIPSFTFGNKSSLQNIAPLKTDTTTTTATTAPLIVFGSNTSVNKTEENTPQKPILPMFASASSSSTTSISIAPTTTVSATTEYPISSSSATGSSIFGSINNQANSNKDPRVFGQVSPPSFNFGASTNTSVASTETSNVSKATVAPNLQTTSPAFSFGNSNTVNASVPTTKPPAFSSAPNFSFGANTQTTSVFGQSVTTSQPQATPTFGQPTTNSQAQAGPIFGQSTTTTISQTQPTPVFGQSNATGQIQPTPVFGQSATTANTTQASSNLFGQTGAGGDQSQSNVFGQASTQAQQNVFGQTGSSTTSQTQLHVFGQTSATTPSNQSSTTNVFGQTSAAPASNPLQSSIFGQPAQNQNQPGGFAFKSPTSPSSQPNSAGGFNFNTNNAASNVNDQKASVFNRLGPNLNTPSNPTAISPSKNLFTFSQNPNTTTTTGNVAATNNIFGGNMGGNNTGNNNNSNNNNNSIFGNASNTSTFGGQNQEQNKNGFNFGSNQNQASNNSPFNFSAGTPSAQNTPASQGSQENKPFMFGQSTGSGSSSTFNQNNAFAFNSNANNNNNSNSNTASPLTGSSVFSFGQATPQQNNNNKPFSFSGTASPPQMFGSQQPLETPKYQFNSGSSGNMFGGNNNNNNATPSFGTPVTPAAPPPAYNFATGSTNGAVFGSGGSTGGSSGAFNFSAPAPLQQNSSGLAFSIGTGGTPSNQRRVIRQATRRLK